MGILFFINFVFILVFRPLYLSFLLILFTLNIIFVCLYYNFNFYSYLFCILILSGICLIFYYICCIFYEEYDNFVSILLVFFFVFIYILIFFFFNKIDDTFVLSLGDYYLNPYINLIFYLILCFIVIINICKILMNPISSLIK